MFIIFLILLILYLLLGHYFHLYLFCFIKKIFGFYCPGCGITRMLYSIITFDFYQAFRYNPLLFIMLPFGMLLYFDYLIRKDHSLYKKIVLDGHTIANHTYSHLIFNGLYSSSTSFINQVVKQEEFIKEKTGVITNIVRFPGGASTAGNLKNDIIKGLREKKYGWVDWSAQDGDGGYLPNKDVAWNNFTNSINQNIEVVLFHDYNKITLSILPDAIKYLKDNNYILLPLFYESNMINK